MKIHEIKVIPVDEWDKLVQETYGKPYSFQQQDDCRPREMFEISVPETCEYDTPHEEIPEEVNGDEMCVDFETWVSTDPETQRCKNGWNDFDFLSFWHSNFYPPLKTVINDLHKKGLLEEGEYSIDIDW